MLTEISLEKEANILNIPGKKLNILHLEDLQSDALLIAYALKRGNIFCDLLVVDTKDKFIKALNEFSPDIILADHSLPSFNSHDALEIFHQTGLKIPFILITAAMSDEFAVDIIKRGADDYILKDRLNRLPVAIHNSLEKFRLEKERRVFLDELIKREKRYRALVENSSDAVVILEAEGRLTYASTAFERILGYNEVELKDTDLIDMSYPGEIPALAAAMQEALANPGLTIKAHTGRMLHKNGTWRWLEFTVNNLLDDAAIQGMVANFRDVTERKLAEQKILHLNRLYAFTSQINQAIVHATDEQSIFEEACRIAIKVGNFKAAWIGLLEKNDIKIKLTASSGLQPGDIALLSDYQYEENGPQQFILKTGTHYVCNDIQEEKILENWKPLASARGYGSTMILPIKKSGHVIGTFNLYAAEVNFFNEDEVALLLETTADISFSLDIFEKEKQRAQAVQRLTFNESRLKEAQAIGHLGSWELDLKSGTCLWSEEALRIYGLSPQHTIQRRDSWLAFVHPADIDYVKQVIHESDSTLHNLSYGYRIIRPDGTIRHVFSQAIFLFDSDGKPFELHGVTHDITQIKEAEDALRESERNLQAIFENTSEGFLLANRDGIIKAFNNKSKDFVFLNVEKEVKAGESVFDFVPEHRRAAYRDIITNVLKGQYFQFDYPYIREDGETKWFNFSITPVYGAQEIEGICIASADITERKQSENFLRQSEAKYRQIVETAQEGIWLVDKNARTTFVNKKMCEILECAEEEMMGKEDFYFIDEADKPKVLEMRERRRHGLKDNTELRFVTRSGKRIWTNISANPVFNEDGTYVGSLAMVSDITESKKVQERNKFQANLLNTIGQAAIATDVNGIVNYWNKSAEDIYGWSSEEALGKNIVDLTPSFTSKGQAQQILQDVMNGDTWSGEFRVKRKNGEDFPISVTNSPFYDEHQKFAGIIGISSDITEKKKLEDLLDKASGMARMGNYEADLKKNTVYWSSMVKEIHEVGEDYTPTPKSGIGYYKEGPSKEAMITAYQEAIEKGIPFDLELQIITAKGNERWVRVIGEVESQNGVSTRIYGSLQDIDKVKKTEFEVLKVYEERNIILESIADAFFAIDKQWTVTYWNKEAERMLNIPKHTILNKNLWEVFSDSFSSQSYLKYHQALETNEVVKFEDYYLEKWFEISTYPSPTGLSVFFKDITERKLSEIRLNELNEQLQKHAKDLAISNKELEEFAYVASHDLQEPLRMVTSFLGQIEKKYENIIDAKGKQYIHYAVDGATRMRQIILDLLEFSRVGRVEEKVEYVDLNEVVAEIILLSKERIDETHATINVAPLPSLQTNKAPVRQVLFNLVSNALKYQKEQQPAIIDISAEETSTHWQFAIKDNGIGIEEQYFNKIFILFQRLHNKDEYSGTGIGLSVCKKIIENMGGRIWVESEWGKGATFYFTIIKKQ